MDICNVMNTIFSYQFEIKLNPVDIRERPFNLT